ncbi:MAG: G/U mismatch-specific DNA glycosylase [Candidatus Binatia bacterium]
MRQSRPTKEELQAAAGKTVADVVAPGLRVLFCGINPGLYSAATGHHFARPGNRFWRTLQRAGFTERVLLPREECALLGYGYGITNIVARATAGAAELSAAELRAGRRRLARKLRRYRPRCLAVLGVAAYRIAFGQPDAKIGRQDETLDGVMLWVLPNPSGLNAHYQVDDLARLFGALKDATGTGAQPR